MKVSCINSSESKLRMISSLMILAPGVHQASVYSGTFIKAILQDLTRSGPLRTYQFLSIIGITQ